MAPTLDKKQVRYLKALAHHLSPLSLVGKGGLSGEFVGQVRQTLRDHELVKVKFNEFKDEKKTLAVELAARTNSALVGLMGNIATLYAPHPEIKRRKIKLP